MRLQNADWLFVYYHHIQCVATTSHFRGNSPRILVRSEPAPPSASARQAWKKSSGDGLGTLAGDGRRQSVKYAARSLSSLPLLDVVQYPPRENVVRGGSRRVNNVPPGSDSSMSLPCRTATPATWFRRRRGVQPVESAERPTARSSLRRVEDRLRCPGQVTCAEACVRPCWRRGALRDAPADRWAPEPGDKLHDAQEMDGDLAGAALRSALAFGVPDDADFRSARQCRLQEFPQ